MGQAERALGGVGKGLQSRSWRQTDQPRMEKGSMGTTLPATLSKGRIHPSEGAGVLADEGVMWQEG